MSRGLRGNGGRTLAAAVSGPPQQRREVRKKIKTLCGVKVEFPEFFVLKFPVVSVSRRVRRLRCTYTAARLRRCVRCCRRRRSVCDFFCGNLRDPASFLS